MPWTTNKLGPLHLFALSTSLRSVFGARRSFPQNSLYYSPAQSYPLRRIPTSRESDHKQQLTNMEDAMKVHVTLISLVFVGLVFAATPAGVIKYAVEKKDAPASLMKKQWQRHAVRL